ncbi:MAG: VWA domain-containing protein [Gammaproteobacteria bacterium]|jgi:nitric oxide reductase NorD protein|nr:VWA domain-containing protein [Gammaproteobacteria bacterium]
MTAWYEFEELVGKRWHQWAAAASSYAWHADAAVTLHELEPVLQVYFRAHGGGPQSLTATTVSDSGHRLRWRQRLGFQQEAMAEIRLHDEHLILPASIAFFPERSCNRELYFWLCGFMSRLQLAAPQSDPLRDDLHWLRQVYLASNDLCSDYPGLGRIYQRLCQQLRRMRPQRRLPLQEDAVEQVIMAMLGTGVPQLGLAADMHQFVCGLQPLAELRAARAYRPPLPVPLWGQLQPPEDGDQRADESTDAAPPTATDAEQESGLQRKRAQRRDQDQAERDDPLLLNPFEKMLSWAEMINVNRAVEDDDLDNARKTVEEMQQLTLSKHQREAGTRMRVELEIAATAVDEQRLKAPLLYPEWHYRKRTFLPDQCAVYLDQPDHSCATMAWQPDADSRRRMEQVKRQFEALRPRRELLRRQYDGAEFDLDALVTMHAEQAAGLPASEKIYQTWREQGRDLAVAILMDVSLSTDAWVEDRRVIDIEKEALLALSHGIQATGDEHAIYTFTSRRRQRVVVNTIKSMAEPVSARVEERIARLQPGLYTRMGAAIRHVSQQLAQCSQQHRLLLLLTDGKPNDTDYYEGRYALEDTRMAIRQARRQGQVVFGVTIDAQAQQYFPQLFGRSGYSIVARPAGLVTALPRIYRQLTRS